MLARRRFAVGAGLLLGLVAVAAAAALTRPTAVAADLVPSLAAALLGVGSLALLARTEERSAGEGATGPTRRGVLVAGGALAVGAAVMGGAGRWITSYRTRTTDVALPAPAEPAPAFPRGLEDAGPRHHPAPHPRRRLLPGGHAADPPGRSASTAGTLTIDGDVDERAGRSASTTSLAMPLIERDITLTCVSNDVGGTYVGGARWLGVRLTDLLDRAGVGSRADQILQHRRRRVHDQHPARPRHRRPRRDDRDRHERPVAAPRARLPRPAGRPRALRLHQRHQVAAPA